MSEPPFIILASNSPRRQDLLSLTGWYYVSVPSNIDETPLPGETPQSHVLRLAEQKARACVTTRKGLILAADTIVVDGDRILGKPADQADASRMLLLLRGRVHRVMTAIALIDRETDRLDSDLCVTEVPMRQYTENEIAAYIKTGDPLDKAGAYAIQHGGFHPVENFRGCFASVMGLPLCHVSRLAMKFNLASSPDLVTGCESINRYICPIHTQVESGADVG